MTRLRLDIESYSEASLKLVGTYRYAADPSTEITLVGWALNDDPIRLATSPAAIRAIPGMTDPDVTKVSHGAFDRVVLSRLFCPANEFLPPDQWVSTLAVAQCLGLPAGLHDLATALKVKGKRDDGDALVRLFASPNKWGRATEDTHPDDWQDFRSYCSQDVEALRSVDKVMGGMPEHEHRVWVADQVVNDNGLGIDIEFARAAVQADIAHRDVAMQELRDLTGLANPRSVQQFGGWLKEQGLPLPNLRAATVESVLESDDLPEVVSRALVLRQGVALAASAKYTAALKSLCEDGRVRGSFKYFGAHTGRWSGKGAQPQNLPKLSLEPDEVEPAITRIKETERSTPLELKALIRPMFVPTPGTSLVAVDFAAIESRVLAWLAGEEWVLERFRQGADLYVELAARMSTPGRTLTRQDGKTATLACGYGGSVGAMHIFGAPGTDEEIRANVMQWRAANPAAVRFWGRLGTAFTIGGLHTIDRITVSGSGDHRRIELPSGRVMHYRNLFRQAGDRELSMHGQKGPVRLWGGLLTENVTQAVARDLLGAALVRAVDAGWKVVGHVHDELIVEARPEDLKALESLMIEAPAWADGLPLAAVGWAGQRYRKD